MKLFAKLLCIASLAFAADHFTEWWTQYRAATAKADAAAVAAGVKFPIPWENGKLREIKSLEDFTRNYTRYFTPEITTIVATKKPERMPNGIYSITWKARGNEYSIYFKPGPDKTFVLDGLSEGPP